MNELVVVDDVRDVATREGEAKIVSKQIEVVAVTAAKLGRWDEMEAALDLLVGWQAEIVAWWAENVRGDGKPSRASGKVKNGEAQQRLGISDSVISRWRVELRNRDAYRARLSAEFRRRAWGDPGRRDTPSLRPTPNRDGPDFWPTPSCLIAALTRFVLPWIPGPNPIWECAAGDGRLARAISAAGRKVLATDAYPADASVKEFDFLAEEFDANDEAIVVTNPPFSKLDEFLEQALRLFDGKMIEGFIFLLRHDHLNADTRVGYFNRASREFHCNWRPIWIDDTDGSPRWAFTWMTWTRQRRGAPLYIRKGEIE